MAFAPFIPVLMFLIKYLPTIEKVAIWLYDDWEVLRENYEKQKAAKLVATALKTLSADEVNKILAGKPK